MFISSIISVFVLGATSFASCSMQQERQKSQLFAPYDDLRSLYDYPLATTYHSKVPSTEGLEELFQLKPIYKPIQLEPEIKHTAQRKQIVQNKVVQTVVPQPVIEHSNTFKLPLRISRLPYQQPCNDRMKKLYNQALECVNFSYKALHRDELLPSLNVCIDSFNEVKQYGINEDLLSKFAMQQDDNCARDTALFYGFLKFYNQQMLTDDGKVEVSLGLQWTPLAEALDLPREIFTEQLFCVSQAIKTLVDDLVVLKNSKDNSMHNLATWLYGDKTLKEENNKDITLDSKWWNSFFAKACRFLNWRVISLHYDELEEILAIVDQAKKQGLLTNEHDLGYDALEYKPTFLEGLTMFRLYDIYKNKISLLCTMIEKYNRLRGSKLTPTHDDIVCYKSAKTIHIIVPETLGADAIAFDEFEQLCKNIDILNTSNDRYVQECVDVLYPL